MTRNIILIFIGLTSAVAFSAGDVSRYPYGNAADASELLGVFKGTYLDFFKLSVQLRVDPTFKADQKSVIRDAMDVLMARALKKEVVDCAYAKATKDLPKSRETFEAEMLAALTPFEVQKLTMPTFAFIARYWGDPKSVGIGYLNLFFDTSDPTPGLGIRHHLHIALNSDFLGYDSSFTLAKDAEYWAGVIAHEFLHNLNYNHPTGYKGSFIKEYGDCVTSNGYRVEAAFEALPERVIVKEKKNGSGR